MFYDLFANITIVASFLFLIGQVFKTYQLDARSPLRIRIILGILLGIMGIALMKYSIRATDTVIVDLRNIAIICGAVFGGPVSSIIAAGMIAAFRIVLYGTNTASITAVFVALIMGAGCACISTIKAPRYKKYIYMLVYVYAISSAAFFYLVRDPQKLFGIFSYYYPITLSGVLLAYFASEYIISSNSTFIEMTYYRIMADNLSDMISTHNPDGIFKYASPSSFQVTGYTPDELIGMNLYEYIHQDDVDAVIKTGENVLSMLDSYTQTYRLKRKDGKYIWLETSLRRIKNKEGTVKEIICATRDISLRKEMEQELVKSNRMMLNDITDRKLAEEELKKLNEELTIQRAEAEKQRSEAIDANMLKSRFLANMSHELRTPLNSIIGFTNRVLKKTSDILPKIQKENLMIVKEEAQHLLELINSLLDYSKIEAGKMEVYLEKFDLSEVIDEISVMAKALIETKPIKYEQKLYTNESIPVFSDKMKTRQILINLLSNAFKYSEEGTVTLSIDIENGTYRIKVLDQGIGISPENIENIFDEFRQVDGSYTRKAGGTGLGLSVTRKFVEMLGGSIQVSSTLGAGSCFTVYLPIRI